MVRDQRCFLRTVKSVSSFYELDSFKSFRHCQTINLFTKIEDEEHILCVVVETEDHFLFCVDMDYTHACLTFFSAVDSVACLAITGTDNFTSQTLLKIYIVSQE